MSLFGYMVFLPIVFVIYYVVQMELHARRTEKTFRLGVDVTTRQLEEGVSPDDVRRSISYCGYDNPYADGCMQAVWAWESNK